MKSSDLHVHILSVCAIHRDICMVLQLVEKGNLPQLKKDMPNWTWGLYYVHGYSVIHGKKIYARTINWSWLRICVGHNFTENLHRKLANNLNNLSWFK